MGETSVRTKKPAVVVGAAMLGYLLAAYIFLAAVAVLVVTLAFDGDSEILIFIVGGLFALGLLLIVGGVRLQRGAGRGVLVAALAITAAAALFRNGTGSMQGTFLVVNLTSVVLPIVGLILALLPATTAWLALRSGVAAAESPPSPSRTQD